jgi:hypothetical protein
VKVQKERTAMRREMQRRPKIERRILEPAFSAGDVNPDKILVALRKINDALDEADDAAEAASHHADDQLDDAFLGVAEVELVDAKAAQKNAEDASHNFLFRARRFVAHSFRFLWVGLTPPFLTAFVEPVNAIFWTN